VRKTLFCLILSFAAPLVAKEELRHPAVFQTSYQGTHPDLYTQQQDRVRILLRQAQLEISSQLGLLSYREGFRCPLLVRFDDTPAPRVEHALAYVQMGTIDNEPVQELVVNLDVMAKGAPDFDLIFYHEMTHAVLNDAVVSRTQQMLPSWVQEGLAVYISGDGDARVKALAQTTRKSQAKNLVRDIELPVLDYARNYLAFKYLHDQHTINSLQAFVRDLTQGKTPEEAIEDSTGLRWDVFREKLKEYSLKIYEDQARPDY
jgi:hypothetical protein